MRPTKGWVVSWFTLLRLLNYYCGLSEAENICLSEVKDWSSSINLCEVTALPQLFTSNAKSDKYFVEIGKVFSNILIVSRKKILCFIKSISQRFIFGRYHIDETVIFNWRRIILHSDGIVTYDIEEYLDDISYLEMPSTRRKEQIRKSSKAGISQYLQLTRSLFWISLGVLLLAALAENHL